jgi:hypothetical protein
MACERPASSTRVTITNGGRRICHKFKAAEATNSKKKAMAKARSAVKYSNRAA